MDAGKHYIFAKRRRLPNDAAMKFTINCDLAEGFGRYRVANDSELMPLVDLANIACGFHASDPVIMDEAAKLAAHHGTKVGAHPSLPDLQGFGRREMRLTRNEIASAVRYQVGALKGFLAIAQTPLGHVKPHGALYAMSARDEQAAHAVCDGAEGHTDTLLGLAGTAHEHVYALRGFDFVPEFYVDLDYDDDGMIITGRAPISRQPDDGARRVVRALVDGMTRSVHGREVAVKARSVCVHSDSENALAVVRSVRTALNTLDTTT